METKLDPRLKDEVSHMPGGENITRCFQCGTCNASCPVREMEANYNPRKIIRMTVLGMRERVLTNEFIWLCAMCYTCNERCPQDVRIPEVMNAIKNLAVQEGYIHPAFAKRAHTIGTTGRLHTVSAFENKRRQELGLPSIPERNEEVARIFTITGHDKLWTKGQN